jgi:hypothetical protein
LFRSAKPAWSRCGWMENESTHTHFPHPTSTCGCPLSPSHYSSPLQKKKVAFVMFCFCHVFRRAVSEYVVCEKVCACVKVTVESKRKGIPRCQPPREGCCPPPPTPLLSMCGGVDFAPARLPLFARPRMRLPLVSRHVYHPRSVVRPCSECRPHQLAPVAPLDVDSWTPLGFLRGGCVCDALLAPSDADVDNVFHHGGCVSVPPFGLAA